MPKSGIKKYYYPTPTVTGPVRIIAEANGVLTLKSVGGEFGKYDEASDRHLKIQVPGGATDIFDLRTRTYREALTVRSNLGKIRKLWQGRNMTALRHN